MLGINVTGAEWELTGIGVRVSQPEGYTAWAASPGRTGASRRSALVDGCSRAGRCSAM
jgi:hypothetical protein